MKLLLARHGQTYWNNQKRLQGQLDSALTHVGKGQARMLSLLAVHERADVIVSSDLKRAARTAGVAAKRLGKKLVKRRELREISYGRLEGMDEADINLNFPGVWTRRQKDRLHYRVPGGENYLDVAKRVKPLMRWLEKNFRGQTVLVVGHGNVNRVLMGLWLKYAPKKWVNVHQPNYVVYRLDLNGSTVKSVDHITLGHHRWRKGLFKVKWWQ